MKTFVSLSTDSWSKIFLNIINLSFDFIKGLLISNFKSSFSSMHFWTKLINSYKLAIDLLKWKDSMFLVTLFIVKFIFITEYSWGSIDF